MNIDQLNALSDYEINCAVAEKLGLEVIREISRAAKNLKRNSHSVWVLMFRGGNSYERHSQKCYTNDPNDYMPIAIEHGIDINFGEAGEVWCDWGEPAVDITPPRPKAQTGRAVCIAFLLMNGESND